ncbi:hypothetical protein O2N63_16645 [Aliiroseovarius sp. KMU-50]|uniref:DUF2059 domain-containing protein n=1 Tax=Aliiroseovarius salicola TaxID=3009082 RepID=A0ABT4W5C1_9RHOB|nr:hypothetical protein [Aliiroseovarius sp. KMU-50]MDA5095722.1 hypothetical protein [Aliiroseovarius sp. KMU-50]
MNIRLFTVWNWLGAVALTVWLMAPNPLNAQTVQMDRLWTALRMDETIDIIREEGMDHAIGAALDLTGRPADEGWRNQVASIYDPQQMSRQVREGMSLALADRDISKVLGYYESKIGQKVIDLEISARRSYLSPGIDEMAREIWDWGAKDSPHAELIRRYVEDADLIERNVAGALNSNLAFLQAFSDETPEEEFRMDEQMILNEVLKEEAQLRLDTTEWLYGYLSMAYAPLSVAELQELVEISVSPQGQLLNSVLFKGFDPMFIEVARALGHAAGRTQWQLDL